ncbi:hypothetical protein [Beijerinckia sp. L45]|uniref:hypothetical protein n=1 Tax=Beijerinckia sp. L45 TaxID=1641855 RepID=UPI00131E1CFD|nr:hypothetical protein [Beijerinckia sp. L45]
MNDIKAKPAPDMALLASFGRRAEHARLLGASLPGPRRYVDRFVSACMREIAEARGPETREGTSSLEAWIIEIDGASMRRNRQADVALPLATPHGRRLAVDILTDFFDATSRPPLGTAPATPKRGRRRALVLEGVAGRGLDLDGWARRLPASLGDVTEFLEEAAAVERRCVDRDRNDAARPVGQDEASVDDIPDGPGGLRLWVVETDEGSPEDERNDIIVALLVGPRPADIVLSLDFVERRLPVAAGCVVKMLDAYDRILDGHARADAPRG